jgi:hypothetical protein
MKFDFMVSWKHFYYFHTSPLKAETQLFSITKTDQLMLFKEISLFIVRIVRNTLTHRVGQSAEILMLKQAVLVVATIL